MSSQPTELSLGTVILELRQGNIALLNVDAVVNAANETLSFGTGVAGAIVAAGGDTIQKECNEIGSCATGSAIITNAGKLFANYVIHAVGPMYGEGNEKEKLGSAIKAALTLAEENDVQSIAFPAIGAGMFHYPIEECASVMIDTIKEAIPSLKKVDRIILCLSDEKKLGVFKNALQL